MLLNLPFAIGLAAPVFVATKALDLPELAVLLLTFVASLAGASIGAAVKARRRGR